MADKLLIIMVNSDPRHPNEVSAPIFQATVAAAMEYDVEIVLTGRSGELAVKGVAERIQASGDKTLYQLIQEAHEAGVRFKICANVLEKGHGDLIPEVEETVGGAYIVSEAMDDKTVTLTY